MPTDPHTALDNALDAALTAGNLELAREIRRLVREYRRLTPTNQGATVAGDVRDVAAAPTQGPPAKPPSLRDLAKWLGCTHGFLSQCKAGTSRIRKSWADSIASVRPDMPATLGKKGTWKATSWADEPSEG